MSLLRLMSNISKHRISGRGVLLNSSMDIHDNTGEGGADQNWTAVDQNGGAFKSFHFAEVINE